MAEVNRPDIEKIQRTAKRAAVGNDAVLVCDYTLELERRAAALCEQVEGFIVCEFGTGKLLSPRRGEIRESVKLAGDLRALLDQVPKEGRK